jgi:drug/metabolite transporter (DMT)-like permease
VVDPNVIAAGAVALTAAAIWAVSLILLKRGLAAGGTIIQGSVVVAGVDSVVYWATLGGLAVAGEGSFAGFSLAVVPIFIASGVVGTAFGRLLSFDGIDRVGASVNSAAISTRPLFATLLALGVLGEVISVGTAVGIVVLVAGMVVLARSKGGDLRGWQPRDLAFPILAAVLFAASDVLRRFGLTETPVSPLEAVAFHETAGVVALLALAAWRYDLGWPSRNAMGVFVVSGVFNAVSLLLYFQAFSMPGGSVAVVTALVGTAPLFVTAFGAVLLADFERITRGVVVAAVLVVVGAALITIG